jgi:hypothetical protein
MIMQRKQREAVLSINMLLYLPWRRVFFHHHQDEDVDI